MSLEYWSVGRKGRERFANHRFLEGKNLTATDIRLALLIIEFSFEAPAEIKVESDREPKAAFLLLERLQGLPAASGLKDEFVDAKSASTRI
jgi:hypothetical protein